MNYWVLYMNYTANVSTTLDDTKPRFGQELFSSSIFFTISRKLIEYVLRSLWIVMATFNALNVYPCFTDSILILFGIMKLTHIILKKKAQHCLHNDILQRKC